MWKNYIHVNFLFVIEYGNNGGDVRCMSLQVRSAQQIFQTLKQSEANTSNQREISRFTSHVQL